MTEPSLHPRWSHPAAPSAQIPGVPPPALPSPHRDPGPAPPSPPASLPTLPAHCRPALSDGVLSLWTTPAALPRRPPHDTHKKHVKCTEAGDGTRRAPPGPRTRPRGLLGLGLAQPAGSTLSPGLVPPERGSSEAAWARSSAPVCESTAPPAGTSKNYRRVLRVLDSREFGFHPPISTVWGEKTQQSERLSLKGLKKPQF